MPEHVRNALPFMALGLGAAVTASGTLLLSGGGFLAALALYMLTGSATLGLAAFVQAARPLRPRLARLLARRRRPALLSH
ncbi:hypothetical protein [Amaricoccus solimangrovi]|uniref:Uncharacterized protein n=1 Tax=Amaricoccus solimangrovi TaxID=2589815 RepID=A0A501WRD9_9RHOB|nr:hypothetical protein [Amaricoccus solimangrovi]TPE51382.1 hypothetical protein FJM51_09075 [Amaricoccus solimangrovi]